MVVPFSKLFFEPKIHFFPSTFLCDHYALILHNKYCKIKLLFFVFTLQYVKRICSNLPCPDCAAHATHFISKLTPDQFATKQNFKLFLFHFHNSVNMRTGKRPFTIEELDAKYIRANTFVVIPYFIKVYSHRNTNVRLLVNSFQKDIMIKDFIKWIRENSHKFDK